VTINMRKASVAKELVSSWLALAIYECVYQVNPYYRSVRDESFGQWWK
jgi:hypothetical protein